MSMTKFNILADTADRLRKKGHNYEAADLEFDAVAFLFGVHFEVMVIEFKISGDEEPTAID